MAGTSDVVLLLSFIIVICTFMFCCSKRTQRQNEANAKIFEMRAASPGGSEIECEDIESSEMDNDNNDDIDLNDKHKKNKNKNMKRNRKNKNKSRLNDIEIDTVEDTDDDQDEEKDKTDNGDIFSDSTDDGMSMARMREEYYKSQTLTKKFTDLLDDIRDILKSKQLQVQNKFTKKKPMIVVPMAMTQQNNINNNNDNQRDKKEQDIAQHSVDSECDEKVREEDD